MSIRDSTTIQSFFGDKTDSSGPTEYYEGMLKQEFVLATEGNKVVGFLTFNPDYALDIDGKTRTCDYITTIIVSPEFRGLGITMKMYQTLFENRRGKDVATRTWSTNHSHLRLLDRMDFKTVRVILSDRGEGINTVYFLKECTEEPQRN